MPESPPTRAHVRPYACESCGAMRSLHKGGCASAKALASAARELDELRTSLTDARFVLAMLVKALEDTSEVNLEESSEYETQLVREAKRVLEETQGLRSLGGCAPSGSPAPEAVAPRG